MIATDRQRLLEYLEQQLVGPRHGPEEIVTEADPQEFYSAGILYPAFEQVTATGGVGEQPEEVMEDEPVENAPHRQPDESPAELDTAITLTTDQKPAAMGISFRISGPDHGLHVTVTGATYGKLEQAEGEKKRRRNWKRVPATGPNGAPVRIHVPAGDTTHHRIDQTPVELRVTWRPQKNGTDRIVTVTLVNTRTIPAGDPVRGEDCFFQAGLTVEPTNEQASFRRFHDVTNLSPDPEERELELLYRRHASFGSGHGCALQWDVAPGIGETRHLSSTVLPRYSVPPVIYDLPPEAQANPLLKSVLSTQFLAETPDAGVLASLEALCDAYEAWIEALSTQPENQDIPAYLSQEQSSLLGRARKAAARMRSGVGVLRDDATAMEAFRLANTAMLMQSRHGRPDFVGSPEPRQDIWPQFPAVDYKQAPLQWRPFQLAFLLLNMEPLANPSSADRDVVDLIWFPTGGGKTEAYLGVSAFAIFYRRLAHGASGDGTTILMRYTLRLLTSQQFERASAMICAAELLRQKDPSRLGHEIISIGLWVGEGSTPNRYAGAQKRLEEAASGPNPFPVLRCPWCGMQIKPGPTHDVGRNGIKASAADFSFFCPQPGCPFHDRLPINIVDDYLYAHPPTLLLGTVDKFAGLPWGTDAKSFFGLADQKRRPPDLIIQDELHLMSGPLGTIVGLYETAIDELCRRDSVRPRIIASTATIRRAGEQVRGLYARDVMQFPPVGLHADDSFFARTNFEADGRLYVGALLPAITSTTAAVRSYAALLQGPVVLKFDGQSRNTFWTLVAYFNSLRELGQAETLASDDIPRRMDVITDGRPRPMPDSVIQNLTSQSAGNVSEILERLRRPPDQPGAVSLLLSSSMISVGVDVSRLGLMIVNGQPKTTAEYIQASSRVGRSSPGLVVTLYSPTKPRDRSHYERFQSYHAAFYRHVEPTSVTPFAPPARERALHTLLVILVRYLVPGMADEQQAPNLREEDGRNMINRILSRVNEIDPGEHDAALEELNTRLEEWIRWAGTDSPALRYRVDSGQYRNLLRDMLASGPGWSTLRSMRNVDTECLLRVNH